MKKRYQYLLLSVFVFAIGIYTNFDYKKILKYNTTSLSQVINSKVKDDSITWKSLTQGELSAGYYKLDYDFYTDKQFITNLSEGEEIYIDLNGHSFTYGGWANWETCTGEHNPAFYGTKGKIYIFDSSNKRNKVELDFTLVQGFDEVYIENIDYQASVWRPMIYTNGSLTIVNSSFNDKNMSNVESIIANDLTINNSDITIARTKINRNTSIIDSDVLFASEVVSIGYTNENSSLIINNSTVNSNSNLLFFDYNSSNKIAKSVTIISSTVTTSESTGDTPAFETNNLSIDDSTFKAYRILSHGPTTIKSSSIEFISPGPISIGFTANDNTALSVIDSTIKTNCGSLYGPTELPSNLMNVTMAKKVEIVGSNISTKSGGGDDNSLYAEEFKIENSTLNINRMLVKTNVEVKDSNINFLSIATSILYKDNANASLLVENSEIKSKSDYIFYPINGSINTLAKDITINDSEISTTSKSAGTVSFASTNMSVNNSNLDIQRIVVRKNTNINDSIVNFKSNGATNIYYSDSDATLNVINSTVTSDSPSLYYPSEGQTKATVNIKDSIVKALPNKTTNEEASFKIGEFNIENSTVEFGWASIYGDVNIVDSILKNNSAEHFFDFYVNDYKLNMNNSTINSNSQQIFTGTRGNVSIVNDSKVLIVDKTTNDTIGSMKLNNIEIKDSFVETMRIDVDNNVDVNNSNIKFYSTKFAFNGPKNVTIDDSNINVLYETFISGNSSTSDGDKIVISNSTIDSSKTTKSADALFFIDASCSVDIIDSKLDLSGSVINTSGNEVNVVNSNVKTTDEYVLVLTHGDVNIIDSTMEMKYPGKATGGAITGGNVTIKNSKIKAPSFKSYKDITIEDSEIISACNSVIGIEAYNDIIIDRSYIERKTYGNGYFVNARNNIKVNDSKLIGVDADDITAYDAQANRTMYSIQGKEVELNNVELKGTGINADKLNLNDCDITLDNNNIIGITTRGQDNVIRNTKIKSTSMSKDIFPVNTYGSMVIDNSSIETNTNVALAITVGKYTLRNNISLSSDSDYNIYLLTPRNLKVENNFVNKSKEEIALFAIETEEDLSLLIVDTTENISLKDRNRISTSFVNPYHKNYRLRLNKEENAFYWDKCNVVSFMDKDTLLDKLALFENEVITYQDLKDYNQDAFRYNFVEWNTSDDASGSKLVYNKSTTDKDIIYYAIWDKKKIESPKTLDNIKIFTFIFVLSLVSFISTIIYLKKKREIN